MNSSNQLSKIRQNKSIHIRHIPRVHIGLNTLLLMLFLAICERSPTVLIPFAAALCHESGHLLVMFLLGVEVQSIEVTLFGAEIRSLSKEYTGRAGQIAIFAAGGISNLISGITAALLGYSFFASCSIALAVVNLLPIRTLDGGCILELLLQDMPFRYSEKILGVVSAIFIFLLWLTAVYIILLCRGNLSLMLFCSYMFVTLYLA